VVAGAALCLLLGAAPAAAETPPEVLNQPVSFLVQNVNKTSVPCGGDGKTYTVRGHLTGPASALESTDATSGTLYLHGLELGEWFWQVPVDGFNHAEELATRGHVSVTIDRLGYGASDHEPGNKSCVGTHATIAHQIVGQLRAGTYGGDLHPKFARVALAGHSLGGAIAQVEAYSFSDVDAVAILSYADTALSLSAVLTSTTWGPSCALGGKPSAKGVPGYAFFTRNQADYRKNFLAQAPPEVLSYADGGRSINPCGDLLSAVPAALLSGISVNRIKVPVLLLMGNKDLVFDYRRLPLQKPLYGGPTTTRVIAGATHGLTVDRTADEFRAALEDWLLSQDF
jgi:pimeloyl-ACP methyl ester carboxylesterase